MLELAGQKFVLRETVDDDVVIFDKATVEIHGIINGNVHALHGTSLRVESTGVINGCVVATDATIEFVEGAKIRKGFSRYGKRCTQQRDFSGCCIDTDNKAIEQAMKAQAKLIARFSENHAPNE